MCSSLAERGYNIYLVVADGKGDELKDRVKILDVGPTINGRLSRMTRTVKLVYKKAIDLDADIYHLHDPELIPIGLKLKKLGKKVIFDAHEDFPNQMLSKPYLNKPLRYILSKLFKYYEKWTLPKFNYLITATPFIRDKLLKINPNTIDINNFPKSREGSNSIFDRKKNEIVYVGGISKIRGIEEIITALGCTKNIRLNLVGCFNDEAFEKKIKKNSQWPKVNELGFLKRESVNRVFASSKIAIVTFLPVPNHINSQPNKLFEYMDEGLPIIASNFQLWREIVEVNNCGICVDPENPKAIGEAIQYLIDNPKLAEQMGKNGLKAVKQNFNWTKEEKKLYDVYEEVFKNF
jgi:glycosyltransferase involved in cell wall biosynthesis